MPPLFDEIVHKALSNDVRRKILLSLANREKYLSEIAGEIKKKPQTIDFHLNMNTCTIKVTGLLQLRKV